MKKKRKILLIISAVLLLSMTTIALVACSAPVEYRLTYYNTDRTMTGQSYVKVTGANTCDLVNFYSDMVEDPYGNRGNYLNGLAYNFDISKDGKTLYLNYTDSLAIRASFDKDKKEISHAGYTYKA